MWTIAIVVALAAPLQSPSPIGAGTESGSVPTAVLVGAADDERSALDAALERAGDRAEAWRAALAAAAEFDPDLGADLRFLVEHMPTRDLLELEPSWVVRDAMLAREAWSQAPWHEQVPLEMFRDAILPYANVDEPREDWRPELRARFLPLVAECTTPGEAAQVLNREVFAALGVKYSTKRRRANQAPSETIEQGLASCTGLSILLADACRAVGVPARLAGIGAWPHKNGNHTWIEVWDGEAWRFTGAAEYDANGLDRAWFVGDARHAVKGDRLHAVMAVTWRSGGGSFHLPWAPEAAWVNGVDVSDRYAPDEVVDDGKVAVRVRVWANGERVEADATILPRSRTDEVDLVPLDGRSRGATADMNDMLEFRVEPGTRWKLSAKHGELTRELELGAVTASRTVDLDLTGGSAEQSLGGQEVAEDLVRTDPSRARQRAWDALLADEAAHADLVADHAALRVRTNDRVSPYTLKKVGERPDGERWPLVIAMHGGGGAPQEVNDQQWRHMQIYYVDHPEAGGYLYLALRAPNNEWNGVYDDAIVPLFQRLIRQMVVCENADPTRVYTLGYSHGGYGAWVIGPKAPDLFAGVHSSAAAPTDGETRLENLANLPFSFMVGELDTAYGRFERSEAAAARLAELRAESDGALYPFEYTMVAGNGHGGLPDRDLLPQLLERRRVQAPSHLVWTTTDDRIADHWWLHLPEPVSGARIEATLSRGTAGKPNRVELTVSGTERVELLLDERHVDLTRPLEVVVNGGEPTSYELEPSAAVLHETLARRMDPDHAATVRIEVGL
ncbi:Transglutaminase-like superfamily protein [Planctomycetes bacterium Pla163]|uniref:Transglutaminase-like superfamily protein n=1 Tax=Rohdeia mirabilis TaxID=2528008 RepID=A0A518D474_9BACT|nr:Transglutaminase-like superfamily protein [Planctomycetes bacterium Pla163]